LQNFPQNFSNAKKQLQKPSKLAFKGFLISYISHSFCLVHKKSKKLASLKLPQMRNFSKGLKKFPLWTKISPKWGNFP